MKWVFTSLIFFSFKLMVFSQSPQTIGHIDSLVTSIDQKKYTRQILLNDTVAMLSGYKEKEIRAYMDGDRLVKTTVRFRNSDRVRDVYYGPGQYYKNKVIYIKDYDAVTNALCAEIYVWDRKLVKSIVTDPLNEDEIRHPEKMIDRANYELLVNVKK